MSDTLDNVFANCRLTLQNPVITMNLLFDSQGIQVLGAKDTNIKGTTYRAGIPNTPYGQHDEHKHQMKPYHPRNMDHIKCYRVRNLFVVSGVK